MRKLAIAGDGGSQGTIENCRVQTLEMCRFEIQGNGGSCSPNPHWPGYAQQQRRTDNRPACTLGRGDNAFNP